MHKLASFASLSIALFLSACGGASPAVSGPAPGLATESTQASSQPSGVALWEIAGERPTYLFGTMHMGVDAAKVFPKSLWDKLSASDTLVIEANITDVDPMKIMARAQYPAGETLDQKLTADEWKALTALTDGDVPSAALKGFRPWFAQTIATQGMMPKTPAVDSYIMERALAEKKSVQYLEDTYWQLALVARLITIEVLKDFLSDIDKQKTIMAELRTAYLAGDLAKIEALSYDEEEMKKYPGMIEEMLDQRNVAWIPKIEKHIATGNVFIAVGAAHFVGDKGLIKLLEKKGYKVSRISLPTSAAR